MARWRRCSPTGSGDAAGPDLIGAQSTQKMSRVNAVDHHDMLGASQMAALMAARLPHRPVGRNPCGLSSRHPRIGATGDRKSVGEGKRVYVRVDLGGRRIIKK